MRIERSMAAYWRNKGKLLCSSCLDRQDKTANADEVNRTSSSSDFRVNRNITRCPVREGSVSHHFVHRGVSSRRWLHAPCYCHVCCTYQPRLNVLNTQTSTPTGPSPAFFALTTDHPKPNPSPVQPGSVDT